MSAQAPYVYLVLGIPGSGRRDIIFDLIQDGIAGKEQVLYFRPEEEATSPFDEQLEALDTVHIVNWQLHDAKVKHGQINAAPEKIIFLAPGTCDPADVAEALKIWSDHNQCQVARIITVVHSAFLSENSAAQAWFDACIHFSDIVLMNRRETVNNKWIKDFEMGYRKQFSPARFLFVKKGRVANRLKMMNLRTTSNLRIPSPTSILNAWKAVNVPIPFPALKSYSKMYRQAPKHLHSIG